MQLVLVVVFVAAANALTPERQKYTASCDRNGIETEDAIHNSGNNLRLMTAWPSPMHNAQPRPAWARLKAGGRRLGAKCMRTTPRPQRRRQFLRLSRPNCGKRHISSCNRATAAMAAVDAL